MAAIAACLVLMTGAVLYFQREQPPAREQVRAEVPAPERQPAPPVRQEQPVPWSRSTVIPAFLLAPGLVRSGGGMTVVRAGQAQSVRIQFLLESDEYQRYHASIETPEGRNIFSGAALRPMSSAEGRTVPLTVPATVLTPGDYIVRLSGANQGVAGESVAEYPFRVAKE
jgi:hypothetical protein